jgi:phage tail sheath protein FI
MATVTTYPGVYIEEFEPGAPIEGVGTSTAAFIGPAAKGDVNTAVKLTSWDAFVQTYGELPLPGSFLWYAVRGFFENGGTVCYVVRATTGGYDRITLKDNAPAQGGTTPPPAKDTIVVRAKELGDHSPDITVKASPTATSALLVSGKKPYNPTGPTIGTVNGNEIATNDEDKAALFLPGDAIDVGGTTYTVSRVRGASIFVTQPVTGTPSGTIKLANPVNGTTDSLRVDAAVGEKLAQGSVLKLSQTGKTTTYAVVKSVAPQRLSPLLTTYAVQLRSPVTEDYTLAGLQLDTVEFKLEVTAGGATKKYENLSMDPANPRYFADVVAQAPDAAVVVAPTVPPSSTRPPFNQPDTGTSAVPLIGGANDDPAQLAATHYAKALAVLEAVDDVNLVCVPDSQSAAVQGNVIAHCEKLMDRFAILDSKVGLDLFGANSIGTQRNGVGSARGYAGLYYPWLIVPPAQGTHDVMVPPSGHVAGIYARTDQHRGVHKAPAGEDAVVNGAIGVEKTMSDTDQGELNLDGINVIRVFKPGGRPVVWGARTTAKSRGGGDSNWQYLNIRRLFEYLEESIQEGVNWAIFETNNLELWQKLKRTITDFLTRAWRDGALFGETAERAFYVRIDEALNPFSEQQLGRLHIEIGCRPSYPAEFIVVRIGIWDGGGEITEP